MQWSWDEFKKIGYGFKSGQTNQKYKTVLNRLNVIETEKQELPETIIKSFKNEEYKSYITIDDIILYRVYGLTPSGTAGAKQLGSFATTEFAESRIDVKLRLALDPQWKNALYIEEKIMVPKGVVLNIGIVAPVKLLSGTILPGGAEQVLLPQDWNENWVVGYRYVTSAPLMGYPTYSSEKINEVRPNTLKTSAEK
ncbi:MAG: hypothetical protein J6B37_02310 [Clostridia bacterium]|nr:hypothetical protein [Clostridia bacterium]